MALVFVALFFFGAHHPLSRKRREDILDTSETNLELPQQQMPGAWSGNKRCLYPLQGWLCWLVLGDMKISCPRNEGWYIFGSKVLCFLLGEETDSSIREFHWLSFSYFFWPFDRLKPTIPSKLSEIFLYWHNVESENVWFVFEQLFSEANIKEAQRCARCMLFVLSYISRKEVQVVGNRRFQFTAGWQPNLHIVLELKVWRSWVGTMHRRFFQLWCLESEPSLGLRLVNPSWDITGKKVLTSNPKKG